MPCPGDSAGKESKTWVRSLGWEDPLEKGKATHSSVLAWRTPWMVQSKGVAKSQTRLIDFHFHFMYRGAWWASVHGVTKNGIRMKWLRTHACSLQMAVPRAGIKPAAEACSLYHWTAKDVTSILFLSFIASPWTIITLLVCSLFMSSNEHISIMNLFCFWVWWLLLDSTPCRKVLLSLQII